MHTPAGVEQLQRELEFKRKALDLVLAIDEIRDMSPEPSAMMSALVTTLSNLLETNLCMIALRDRETGRLKIKAIRDQAGQFSDLTAERLDAFGPSVEAVDQVHCWQEQPPSGEVYYAAISIELKQENLGLLLCARTERGFEEQDIELIKIAESQVDSAVIQAYAYYTLQQRNKELETIARVDMIRDQHLPFEEMLDAVLKELRSVIQAESGFIMLYNPDEKLLELKAVTSDDLGLVAPHQQVVQRVVDESLRRAELVCEHDINAELRSIMCVPLILHEQIIGVFGVINHYGNRGFDAEDRRLLSTIGSQIDTAIFESLERRQMRELLGRSVDPRVMERLLSASTSDILTCDRAVLSVLYADIRGSTALAEHLDPDLLVGFINEYLSRMTEVIFQHEGTLDKFVGDEVMALFGAPFPQADHAVRAVRAALAMQHVQNDIMTAWEARGVEPTPIGIGIATGELIVGEVGCSKRSDYTVIGRAANLGSRLCSAARGGQILISEATYRLVHDQIDAIAVTGLALKGVDHDVTAYHVRRLITP